MIYVFCGLTKAKLIPKFSKQAIRSSISSNDSPTLAKFVLNIDSEMSNIPPGPTSLQNSSMVGGEEGFTSVR